MYNSNPSCHHPCLWVNFDFGVLLQLSATMCTCYLGHSTPWIGHFCSNLGVSLAVNGVFGWKTCGIPIPGFVDLSHEPVLILGCFSSIPQSCVHVIWAKSDLELLVLAQNGRSAWQKMLWFLKMPRTIVIPGFIIYVCKPILILECFCSSLQSRLHVIWARVVIKLSIFGQIWGSAWH